MNIKSSPAPHTRRSPLRRNFIALYSLQIVQYTVPLITLPYLGRVLGPALFGTIALAQALIAYFLVVVDYGFSYSGTREIALSRDNPQEVAAAFARIMAAKLLLLSLSLATLTLLVAFIPSLRTNNSLYYITFLSVLGSVLNPGWYFQGLEKSQYVSGLTMASSIISLSGILIFVRTEQDYLNAAFFLSGQMIVPGAVGLWLAIRSLGVPLAIPSAIAVRTALIESWAVFLSNLSVTLYSNTIVLILGIVSNRQVVGYYSAADKITKATLGLFTPASQAIYPRVNALMAVSGSDALAFLRRCLPWAAALSFCVSVLLMIGAEHLVTFAFGTAFSGAIVPLQIMAMLPFVVVLSNIFGVQTMLPFNMKQAFSRILVGAGFFNLVLLIPLVVTWGASGAASSLLITEVIVTVAMYVTLRRHGILFIHRAKPL